MGALLELEGVSVRYGAIEAVRGIDIDVEDGEIVTLIGANGAGKTTILRTISGLLRPAAGTITFAGERIDTLPAHAIVERGIGHAPEGRRVFPRLSVIENLRIGAFVSQARRRRPAPRPESPAVEKDLARVFDLFPVLSQRSSQQAGTLSGGEQQMLAIGRALMGHPRLLMLDEPSMGLAPMVVQKIFEVITEINSQGTTILLVEQNAQMALRIGSRGFVLEASEVALKGSCAELLVDARVKRAYLGEL